MSYQHLVNPQLTRLGTGTGRGQCFFCGGPHLKKDCPNLNPVSAPQQMPAAAPAAPDRGAAYNTLPPGWSALTAPDGRLYYVSPLVRLTPPCPRTVTPEPV